jgi:hypothetical protein
MEPPERKSGAFHPDTESEPCRKRTRKDRNGYIREPERKTNLIFRDREPAKAFISFIGSRGWPLPIQDIRMQRK